MPFWPTVSRANERELTLLQERLSSQDSRELVVGGWDGGAVGKRLAPGGATAGTIYAASGGFYIDVVGKWSAEFSGNGDACA